MMIFMMSLPQCRGAHNSSQRLEVDVLDLDAVVVALEADESLLTQDARVFFGTLLDVLVEVGIHQHLAVVHDRYLAALGDDGDAVPFADGLVRNLPGRHHVVNGAAVLPRLQALPVQVVDYLAFHAGISRVALKRRAQGDAAVAVLGHLVFEAELEVAVLLFGQEPAAAAAADVNDALLGAPDLFLAG